MKKTNNIPFISKNIARALSNNNILVIADRGCGKTFLIDAATSEDHRVHFDCVFGNEKKIMAGLKQDTKYLLSEPTPELLERLGRFYGKKMAWLTVILGQSYFDGMPAYDWDKKAQWIKREISISGSLDDFLELHQSDDKMVFLFDDPEMMSDDMDECHQWKSTLIQVAEDLRFNKSIQIKIFARPETWNGVRLPNFMTSTWHSIEWNKNDLKSLFMHQVVNNGVDDRAYRLRGFLSDNHPDVISLMRDNLANPLLKQPTLEVFFEKSRRFHATKPLDRIMHGLSDAYGHTSPQAFNDAVMGALNEALDADINHDGSNQCLVTQEIMQKNIRIQAEKQVHSFEKEHPKINEFMHLLLEKIKFSSFKYQDVIEIVSQDSVLTSFGESVGLIDRQIADEALDFCVSLGVLHKMKSMEHYEVSPVYQMGYGFGMRGGLKPTDKSNENHNENHNDMGGMSL